MSGQAFPKHKRLLSRSQFQSVFRRGSRTSKGSLVLVSLSNTLGYSRLGIAVSKRAGKAVVRNRLKRLLREIYRRCESIDVLSRDMVFVVRSPIVEDLNLKALRNDFRICIAQLT